MLDIIGSGAEGNIKLSQAATLLGKVVTISDSMLLFCNTDKDDLIQIEVNVNWWLTHLNICEKTLST